MDKLQRARIEGASKSLRKTMNDIEAILDGDDRYQDGELREELRAVIRHALADTAYRFLRVGFKGGHLKAAQHFRKAGQFPLRVKGKLLDALMPGETGRRDYKVASELPNEEKEAVRSLNRKSRSPRNSR